MKSKLIKSFSLIEVLIFITILSLFFIAAMTVTVFSLRSMKNQEYKILATHLAEEAIEWIKSEKEDDWSAFITYDISAGAGTTYCLENLDWLSKFSCSDYNLGTPAIFKRELLIKNIGSPTYQVNADIIVSWLDSNKENKIIIKTVEKLIE